MHTQPRRFASSRTSVVVLLLAVGSFLCLFCAAHAAAGPESEAASRRAFVLQREVPVTVLSAALLLLIASWWKTRRQEDRLAEILASVSPDTVLVIDPKRTIRMCNASVARMFGYSPREVIGRPTDCLYADRRRDRVAPGEVRRVMEEQGYHVGFAEGRRNTGETIPLEIISAPLRRGRGAVLAVRDITERLHADEERRLLETQMRGHQKVESLGMLAARLAQEFEAELDHIRGHVSDSLAVAASEPGPAQYLVRIRDAWEHAAGLCQELRTYAGGGEGQFQLLDLSSVVLRIGRLLEVSLSRRAVLRLNLPAGLPPVRGDVDQIRQVVMNLITNASDALGKERGTIALSGGAREFGREELAGDTPGGGLPPGFYVFLEVSDTGCGMDAATMARIFDPFFTTKPTGRGLGLASVLGIIRRHSGALRVWSEKGRGTRFTVLLPPADSGRARPPPPPAAVVLVADDDKALRMDAAKILSGLGCAVVAGPGGLPALQTFGEQTDVSVVLLDTPLPPYSAKEAAQKMLALRPDTVLFIMSTEERGSVIREYEGLRVTGFLEKPLDAAALQKALVEAGVAVGNREPGGGSREPGIRGRRAGAEAGTAARASESP
jgi:PAS domain S-box-containing protein